MKSIGFVILHYSAIDDTRKCIESIINRIDTDNYVIIVVDNDAPDKSGYLLENEYSAISEVEVVCNKKNYGFAVGNNVGYRIAKEKYECEFICMLNNDTFLLQDDFFIQIQKDYEKFDFYVAGPYVANVDPEKHTNPMQGSPLTVNECNKKIRSLEVQLLLNHICLDAVAQKLVRLIKSKQSLLELEYYLSYQQNIKLHGCCLIFSPKYISEFNGLHEGTFLFLEEDLLFLQMQQLGYLTLYSPMLKIFHTEDVSTNLLVLNKKKKRRFILENHKRSMLVIRDYLLSLA